MVTYNVDKWKLLKDRPHYFHNTKSNKSDSVDQSDSDDDFDLPRTESVPHHTPIQQHQQEEEQGPEAPRTTTRTTQTVSRTSCTTGSNHTTQGEVAYGPWRSKQSKPSSRKRKRRQQASQKRDNE